MQLLTLKSVFLSTHELTPHPGAALPKTRTPGELLAYHAPGSYIALFRVPPVPITAGKVQRGM